VVSFWTLFLFKKRGGNRSARSKTTQNHVSTTGQPSIPGSEQAGAAVVSSLTDPLTGLVTDSTTLERIESGREFGGCLGIRKLGNGSERPPSQLASPRNPRFTQSRNLPLDHTLWQPQFVGGWVEGRMWDQID